MEAFHTFDSTQTNQLVPIESSIQSMKEWVQQIEGLFKEGLTDVKFPTDNWSSIVCNSAIVMSLSAMDVETGIESQDPLFCERPVETDVKGDKAWYKVVEDVLVGITERDSQSHHGYLYRPVRPVKKLVCGFYRFLWRFSDSDYESD